MYQTEDLRIRETRPVVAPAVVRARYPITEAGARTVYEARTAIHHILNGRDDRLLLVMGPCSIHDVAAAREYARGLKALAAELADALLVVMRVYFEKPRTTVGWKGLINDPHLDNSFHINEGLHVARELLVWLADVGVPAATEYLDLISPQYVSDLVSWGAIGARTTESQGHRELASGLSCPIGFKNGTDGNLRIAIDAIRAAANPHHFLGVNKEGEVAILATHGNQDTHIILRGGKEPNYDATHVAAAKAALRDAGQAERLMVDCSHANSRKQHALQRSVATDVSTQIRAGERGIVGVMVESNLVAGRQDAEGKPREALTYGQSITDACLGWEESVALASELAAAVRARRAAV